MTVCIGVIDKENHCCYVGADSCVSSDSFHTQTKTVKCFYAHGREDVIWGCAGSIRMANLIFTDTRMFPVGFSYPQENIFNCLITKVIPILKEYADTLSQNHNEFDLILAIKDQIFRIQEDLSVYEIDDNLITIGCGCSTAYGAMKAFESINLDIPTRIQQSISISAGYDYGVSTPSTIFSTDSDS